MCARERLLEQVLDPRGAGAGDDDGRTFQESSGLPFDFWNRVLLQTELELFAPRAKTDAAARFGWDPSTRAHGRKYPR